MNLSLREFFQRPSSTLESVDACNGPSLTRGLMGLEPVEPIPPPANLVDLGAYFTPFKVLFNRPANRLTGR
jgi:hypothetical protein